MRLSLKVNRLRSVNMLAPNFMCFYLSLILVALPQDATCMSTPVNKTTSDGKVFITGDHNEVILSASQETKKALTEITSKLDSLNEKDAKFSKQFLSLGNSVESVEKHMRSKMDLMNKSTAALSVQVQVMSQRLTALEKQGTHVAYFECLFLSLVTKTFGIRNF